MNPPHSPCSPSRRTVCLTGLALGAGWRVAAAAGGDLAVGIVPQQSATALARTWIPMLQEVAARSGLRLAFRTAPDIPAFEDRLQAGEFDLAYMNPYHYTVFSRAPGYRAFAKERDRRLVGVIVVRKDSPAADLKALAGKAVAFPAPAAFAASILTRAEFSRQGIPIDTRFVASHDSVYLGIARGLFAAGGGVRRTLEAIDPAIGAQLRVLSTTPAYVPHAFAAHPRVGDDVVARVLAAMQSLSGDDKGRELLRPLSFKGVDAARDAEWDEIRRLRIDERTGRQS